MHHDGLEPLTPQHGLVGSDFVEAFAFGVPAVFPVFKDRRGMSGLRFSEFIVGLTVEMDSDHRQEDARLSVPGPKDFVMPAGIFPANPFQGIDLRKRPEEMRLKPLPLHTELLASEIDVHFFRKLTKRPAEKHPADSDADRQDHAPDESHD